MIIREETINMLQAKKDFSYVGWMYTLMTLAVMGAQIVTLVLAEMIPSIGSNTSLTLLLSTVAFYIAGAAVLVPSMYIPNRKVAKLEKNKLGIKAILQYFCIGYFMMIVGNLIGLTFTAIVGMVKGGAVSNPLLDVMLGLDPLVIFFLTVVGAPIIEEIFFRKFIIDKVHIYGKWPALFISGLMFGLFHANANQFFYAFILGVFFGYVYLKAGSVIPCIILHAMMNSMGYLASQMINLIDIEKFSDPNLIASPDFINQISLDEITGILVLLVFELIILVIVIVGLILFILKFKQIKQDLKEEGKVISIGQAILNAGMIVFVVYTTAQIVLQLLS